MPADIPLGEQGITILRRSAALLALAALLITLNNVDPSDFQWLEVTGLCGTVLGVIVYVLLKQGKYFQAVRLYIWGAGLIVMGFSFIAAGVRTPSLVFLPVLCMAAAWLISVRNALALAACSLLVISIHLVTEYLGYAPPNMPRNSLSYALMYLFTFIAAGIVAWGSTRSFTAELDRSLGLSDDLKRQVEELRQSEQRFSALFRANPMPSSTIDQEGRTLDVNDAWVALYGISAEEAIGKTAQEMAIWSDPQERKAVYVELAKRGRVDGAPMTLRTACGEIKPFLLYIAQVEFGGQQRLVTSMLDQSDRHAAEAAQRAVSEELEKRVAERTAELTSLVQTLQATQAELVEAEKLASLGAMVAGISHELNTPLGVAVTVASTLQDRVADVQALAASDQLKRSTLSNFLSEQDEMATVLMRSIERAAALVSSFKQVAVDRASERRRTFNLAKLVDDIVTSVQPGMDTTRLTLSHTVSKSIVCDSLPGPVGQVLTNLLQNAKVHAFDGRASGRITVDAEMSGSGAATQVVLRVQDDGTGMSDHVRRHAFDPFFTTRLGQGGSGLGLSVSHQLAKVTLGGNLSVESSPGSGSCFTFCFLQNLS